jgi:hypothetical protein
VKRSPPSKPTIVGKGVLPDVINRDPALHPAAVLGGEEIEKPTCDPKAAVHQRSA